MEELQEKFPIAEVSDGVLAGIARRAREQHATGEPAGAPASVQRQLSPFMWSLQKWMSGAGLGVLDLAAIAALLFLSVSLLWMYASSARRKTAANQKLAVVNPQGKSAENGPIPAPKSHAQQTVLGDGPDTPKTPEPAPAPAPEPQPEPRPGSKSELLKLKAEPNEPDDIGPPEDIPVVPALARDPRLPEPNTEDRPSGAGSRKSNSDSEYLGRGSFGARNGGGRRLFVKRYGGSQSSEEAVELALRWLAYHQEPDGHFDSLKYGSANKVDTAVTALSLLTFLAAGHTEKVGVYKDNVTRALAWLKSKQQGNGLVFDQTDAGAHRGIGYPHAIAALALAEAAGMGRVPNTVAAAQKAIDYCTDIQQNSLQRGGKGGWRYTPDSAGDISVTGWYLCALKAARVAGLHVDHTAFDDAIQFLDSLEIKENGVSRYKYMPNADSNRRRCAIGNFCRQFLGRKNEELQTSVEAFVNSGGVPEWGVNGETADPYYWYYGTLCTFQQGGDVWKKWNVALKMALLNNQCKQGDDCGSWPPVGDFSSEWGRVGQTAFCALSCEVYYRYMKIQRDANPDAAQPLAPDASQPVTPDQLAVAVAPPPKPADKMKTKVTFRLIDKKLTEAVALLNQLTEVKIKLDPSINGADIQLSLSVTEMPLDLSIGWVTKVADLEWREEKGAVVICRKKPIENEKKPASATSKDEF
jgi:hypothetical protein